MNLKPNKDHSMAEVYYLLDAASNILFVFICLQFTLVVVDWYWAVLKAILRTCTQPLTKRIITPHNNRRGILRLCQKMPDADADVVPYSWD